MHEFHIEEAKVTVADTILDIQKAAYISEAEIYDDYDIPPLTQTLTEIESDFATHIFYVAKLHGQIAGSVNIKVEGYTGYIGRLIVEPEMQNLGIGTLLMSHVEAMHADLDAFELFTGDKSERNLSFYGKRGYLEFMRKPVHENLVFVFMRKKNADKPLTNDAHDTRSF